LARLSAVNPPKKKTLTGAVPSEMKVVLENREAFTEVAVIARSMISPEGFPPSGRPHAGQLTIGWVEPAGSRVLGH